MRTLSGAKVARLCEAIEQTRVSVFTQNKVCWYVEFDEELLGEFDWIDIESPFFESTLCFETEEMLMQSHSWFNKIQANLGQLSKALSPQDQTRLFLSVLENIDGEFPSAYIESPPEGEEHLHTVLCNREHLSLVTTPAGTHHWGVLDTPVEVSTNHTGVQGTGLSCGLPKADSTSEPVECPIQDVVKAHLDTFCNECLQSARWLMYTATVDATTGTDNVQSPPLDTLVKNDLEKLIVIQSEGPGDHHGMHWVFDGQQAYLHQQGFIPQWDDLLEAYCNDISSHASPPTLPNNSEKNWSSFMRAIVPSLETEYEQGPESQRLRDHNALVDFIREATYVESLEEMFNRSVSEDTVVKVGRDSRVFHLRINTQDVWRLSDRNQTRKRNLMQYLRDRDVLIPENTVTTETEYNTFVHTMSLGNRERYYWEVELPLVKTDEPMFENLVE